ncbi:MAG: HAD-IIIC family phosphatase [Candidatus Omnitrophica bacterium]|nr:HAD-IIIC family phosphatase [Candidatus Omnitrophota bacterium]
MDQRKFTCVLISDFNMDNFVPCLSLDDEFPLIAPVQPPFGQMQQVLIDPASECWSKTPDCAVVWSSPHAVSATYAHMLQFKSVDIEQILREVDDFSSLLLSAARRVRYLFVPALVLPSYVRGWGLLDMRDGIGTRNALMKMNLRLVENLKEAQNIFLLNTQLWIEAAGKNAFHTRLWYMAKIPFGNDVFKEAARDIKAALRSVSGYAKKIIILDLDDTLWGGVVGDAGWENIRLGGHDPVGEAFVDFQQALKSLTRKGVLLGIVSKNEEGTALEAIRQHGEMVLKPDDFAGWRINWQDKARNIVDLVEELNLGLDSVVYLDDNPAERDRVRNALPEVFVPELPENTLDYPAFLTSLRCFDLASFNQEDGQRSRMYREEKQRDELKKKMVSVEDWLKSLEIQVTVEELNEGNLPRTAQLLNKTNQMNLATRRMTEVELMDWVRDAQQRKSWVFYVSDKFGNSGLTGIASIDIDHDNADIADFVLSCRVLGRKVEDVMLKTVIDHCRPLGIRKITARYIPTSKNQPCLRFFESSAFKHAGNNLFVWEMTGKYPVPSYINVV